MKTLFDTGNGAAFSDCRKYRYALWRIWDEAKPKVMFIGLNPSTANEDVNDATIRRVITFAKLWGFGGVYMMNCFPFISTNPNDLKDHGNTSENDMWLYKVGRAVSEIVFAWGNFEVVREYYRDLQLLNAFPSAMCLCKNKNGSPKHPLYVASNIQRIKYKS